MRAKSSPLRPNEPLHRPSRQIDLRENPIRAGQVRAAPPASSVRERDSDPQLSDRTLGGPIRGDLTLEDLMPGELISSARQVGALMVSVLTISVLTISVPTIGGLVMDDRLSSDRLANAQLASAQLI